MNVSRLWIVVVAVWLVFGVAGPAFSQRADATPAEPFSAAYVSAFTGASFASETKATFAGEYGERVTDHVQAYANITHFDDLMSDAMRDRLAMAAAELTDLTGEAWDFSGRDRGLAVTVECPFISSFLRRHAREYPDLVGDAR